MDCDYAEGKSKQVQFREYLEKTGVNSLIETSLMKLIELKERPQDPIAFFRNQFCDDLPDYDEILSMRKNLADLRIETAKTLLKLNAAKSIVKLSDEEAETLLATQFEALDDNENVKSLLKEFLEPELFENLKELKTKLGGTLWDNIRCGLSEYDHEIGVFASDQYAYETFDQLFAPILEEVHEIGRDDVTITGSPSATTTLATNAESGVSVGAPSQPELDWGDAADVIDLDPKNLFVKSNSITIGRALKDVRFMSTIKYNEIQKVGEQIRKVLEGITDEEFVGKYHDLSDIGDEEKKKWIEEGILFNEPEDKFLKAAGTYSMWPLGRGLFLNEKKNLRVWINEEEHLQVTSFNDDGNLHDTYGRLVRFMDLLEELEFARHIRWGFAAHNLKNIGNTMRVTVKAKIPQLALAENSQMLAGLTDANDLESKTLGCGSIELTNKKRFGVTEIDTVIKIQSAIAEIINTEKCLYV